MKLITIVLLCMLQSYDAVVGYTTQTMQPAHVRRLLEYERMQGMGMRWNYDRMEGFGWNTGPMEGPGLNPFVLPHEDMPRWGYNERMPLARYSDFNDYRRGAPADWGPHMGPMGAFSPYGRVNPYLEQIKRKRNLSDREVQDLFFLWNDALATLDPDAVTRRYARNSPILLPTVSDVPRTDYNTIRAYFVEFLKKRPQGTVLQSHITRGNNWCMDAGIYEFVMGSTGEKVTARYTFLYTYEDGEWRISHHHSSAMPENKSSKSSTSTSTPVRMRQGWIGDGVMMRL